MTSPSVVKPAHEGVEMPKWTFLTNHSHVLILLTKAPDLTLRDIGARIGITERAVHKIVSELEASGYLERDRVGRRNRYKFSLGKSLRHPVESHKNIGDIIKVVLSGMKL